MKTGRQSWATVLVALCVMMVLSACSIGGANTPKQTATLYIESIIAQDFQKLAAYTGQTESEITTTLGGVSALTQDMGQSELDEEQIKQITTAMRLILKQTKYTIGSEEVNGTRAVVTADIKGLDLSEFMRSILAEMTTVYQNAGSDANNDATQQAVVDAMLNHVTKIQPANESQAINLHFTQQGDKWVMDNKSLYELGGVILNLGQFGL